MEPVEVDVWNHYVMTWNRIEGSYTIFFNGVQGSTKKKSSYESKGAKTGKKQLKKILQ